MDSATPKAESGSTERLSVPDRALYALFARHADAGRHRTDRRRYRGTDLRTSFEVFLARAYGLSWLVGGLWAAVGWTAASVVLRLVALPGPLAVVPPAVVVACPDHRDAVVERDGAGVKTRRRLTTDVADDH